MQAVFFCLLIAQNAQGGSGGTDLDRVRKALERQPTITTESGSDESGRPVFRMNINARKPAEKPWDNWSNVPSYIRPMWRGYHYEFLEMVTPEDFRSATLFPVGVEVIGVIDQLKKHFRETRRKAQEQKAREEVAQALASLK